MHMSNNNNFIFNSDHGLPGTSEKYQPAPPRPAMTSDEAADTSAEPWPLAFGHDEPLRQTAPQREQADAPVENEPFVTPSEEPRPNMSKSMSDHGEAVFSDVVEHGPVDEGQLMPEPVTADEPTWPVVVEEEVVKSEPVEETTRQVETPAVESPPESADLVTVEEAVQIFRERGLPRHMRTIQKYCSRKTGRVLESYQVPTENGIRYMIERSSIDRFIGDAAMQAPTGKLENAPLSEPAKREQGRQAETVPVADQIDIFDHPYIKKLEKQVERLESRNEQLQANIQNVLEQANERLVELQKAAAVAQSESLGKFLLESERIRGGQEKTPPITVNRGAGEFPEFDV